MQRAQLVHRALISTPSLLSLPPCFSPRSPSRFLDPSLFFGHQAFILAPIILDHPTYSDQCSPFIPRLSPAHRMQSDASCEAETSFLSCFAFDDYELTCSTTSRPCSFPFDSLRVFAHATASFSLRSISFIFLLLNISSYRTSFFFSVLP